MSELCLSSTPNTQFHSLLLSDFALFCSLILSHPLYFSYFIFFSPYLLKLLSFLSPLFITTSLLLLALLTFSPNLTHHNHNHPTPEFSQPRPGFLLSTFHTIVQRLGSKIKEENEGGFQNLEEFEVYKIVFDTSTFDVTENPVEVSELISESSCNIVLVAKLEENPGEFSQMETTNGPVMEEKRLESLFKELDEFENMTYNVGDKKVESPSAKPNKVVEEHREKSLVRNGSDATGREYTSTVAAYCQTLGGDGLNCTRNVGEYSSAYCQTLSGHADNGTSNGGEYTAKVAAFYQTLGGHASTGTGDGGKYTSKVAAFCQTLGGHASNGTDNVGDFTSTVERLDSNLGSYGSMRKEKEWKRTLACKLYEERLNGEGEEGMDSLWERYAMDSSKAKAKGNTKKKNKKKGGIEYYEDEDEEEEERNGQLCCLQALKLSAGKMNLGMGRPNLVRISKVLKGMGWLHQVGRHGKKHRF